MVSQKKVVILGAGPAGLAAALELVENGYGVTVIEREGSVGGISKTIQYKGYRFDVGGHRFFTKSKEVNDLWNKTLKQDFIKTPRLSRIYYNNKFFQYPIQLKDTFRNVGVTTSCLCFASYVKYKIFPIRDEKSFADWVTNRFGKRLFEMFFKSYTEKVWGVPTNELSAEWASQRIKDLSMWGVIKNAIFKPKVKAKSLIEEFMYPKYGPGMMYEAFGENVLSKGGRILLNHNIIALNNNSGEISGVVVVDKDNKKNILKADYFISTIPLPDTVRFIEPKLNSVEGIDKKLRFRDFISVNLILKKKDVFPDCWIYIHDPKVVMGRIQNYKNWSKHMTADSRHTPLGCEYFCNQNDELWSKSDKELIRLATAELEIIGLADKEDVVDGMVYRMRDAYPVYIGDYKDTTEKARKALSKISNLKVAGRGGLFRYNNMDHSILAGLYAAREIMGQPFDPWVVNEEKEYHESSEPKKD